MASATWIYNGSDNWTNNARWSPAAYAVGVGATASFTGVNLTTDISVTVNTPITIGNLTAADNTSPFLSYVITGGNTLTLDNSGSVPVITTNGGFRTYLTCQVSSNLGFTKQGTTELFLAASNLDIGGTVTLPAGAGSIMLQPNITTAGGSTTMFRAGTNFTIASGQAITVQPYHSPVAGQTVTLNLNGNFSGGGQLTQNNDVGTIGQTVVNGSVAGLGVVRAYRWGSFTVPDLPTSGTLYILNIAGDTTTFNINAATAKSGATNLEISTSGSSTSVFKSIGAGTVTTSGRIQRTDATAIDTTLILGGAGGAFTIEGSATNSSANLINLTKQDGGTVILNGDNALFRNNTVTLSGGTLRGGTATAFGASAGGSVTMVAGTAIEFTGGITFTKAIASARGTIRSVSGANIVNSSMTMADATTFETSSAAASLTMASGGAIAGGFGVTLAGDGDITINRQFSAATTLTKNGTGTSTLTDVSNAFTGAVAHNAGTLAFAAVGSLGSGTTLSMGSASVLRYTGATGGTMSRSVSATNLTGGFENNGDSSFAITAGTLSGTSNNVKLGGSGAGQFNILALPLPTGGNAFTKTGAGRWIYTGTNPLTGTTSVTATATTGTLMAAPSATTTNARLLGATVNVGPDAGIQIGSDNGQQGRNRYTNLTVTGSSTSARSRIRLGGSAVSPTVQMSGNLTINSGTTWDVSADVFKTPGQYTLVEFTGSGVLVGGAGSLANVTTLVKPVGFEARTYTLGYSTSPINKITLTIS